MAVALNGRSSPQRGAKLEAAFGGAVEPRAQAVQIVMGDLPLKQPGLRVRYANGDPG